MAQNCNEDTVARLEADRPDWQIWVTQRVVGSRDGGSGAGMASSRDARAAPKCSNQTAPGRPHPTSTTSTKSGKTFSDPAATSYGSDVHDRPAASPRVPAWPMLAFRVAMVALLWKDHPRCSPWPSRGAANRDHGGSDMWAQLMKWRLKPGKDTAGLRKRLQ